MSGPMTPQMAQPRAVQPMRLPGRIWLRWVLANGAAEMVGLGISGILFVTVLLGWEARTGVLWAALITVVASTLVEGTAVGVLQGRVLRGALPQLSLRAWWIGTSLGALVAWTAGMLPSTLMSMAEESTGAAPVEMSQWLTLLLAAGLGALAGPILGIGQWWVLRAHVQRAWLWIPAQSLAWAAGMPLIFQLMDWVAPGRFTLVDGLIVVGMLFAAGAVVGALHGWVLLHLLRAPSSALSASG